MKNKKKLTPMAKAEKQMKAKLKVVTQLYAEKRRLEDKAFKEVQKAIKKHGGVFDWEEIESYWIDEANNEISKIDSEYVYILGGTMDSYPISDLGLNDMLFVLSELS